MKIYLTDVKNLFPGDGEGGSGENLQPNYADWNDLFSDTKIEVGEEGKKGEEGKTEEQGGSGEKKDEKKGDEGSSQGDSKKDESSDIKAEAEKIKAKIDELKGQENLKEKTEEELREIAINEVSGNLRLDFGTEKKDPKVETVIDFTDIAKSVGIEIGEGEKIESTEILKDKLSALTEAKIGKIKEEYSSYNELSEREKDLVHVLKNFGDKGLHSYLNPSEKIESYLSLDDQDLIEEDYKLTIGKDGHRLSEDEVAERVAEDIENGKVREKADAIRNLLYVEKRKIQDNLLIRAREESLNKEQKIISERAREKETIVSSLNAIKEIAPGVPMDDNIKNYILKSYESGEFEKTFKNSNDKIKSFIFAKKGEEIIKHISQAQYKKGKLDVLSRLDLTGSPQAGEAGTGSRTIADGGGFASWKNT